MFSFFSWTELRIVLALAAPILMGQVAQTGMGVVDTMMAGQVSAEDLAGVALGTAVWLPIYLFASGVLLVLTPMIATAISAGNSDSVKQYLWHGFLLASLLAILGAMLLYKSDFFLSYLQLEVKVFQVATDYLVALSWGVFFGLWFQVIRFFHDAHGYTSVAMWLAFIGFSVNIPLNVVFVYGWWIIPAMGGAGCGVATSVSYLIMFLLGWAWFFYHHAYRQYRSFQGVLIWATLTRIFWSGLPIASAILFEVGLFIFIAFLITPLGTLVLAAHQVAISYTSMAFMLPLSIAMALTVHVGHLRGKEAHERMKRAVVSTLVFSVMMGAIIAVLTLLSARSIAQLYSDDLRVIEIALGLIVLAGLYQISDAIQVVSAGALRGVVDTVSMMWITLIAYWLIALPTGYLLCYYFDFGVAGFWMSFIVGLSLAAIGLLWRVYWRFWRLGAVVSR